MHNLFHIYFLIKILSLKFSFCTIKAAQQSNTYRVWVPRGSPGRTKIMNEIYRGLVSSATQTRHTEDTACFSGADLGRLGGFDRIP